MSLTLWDGIIASPRAVSTSQETKRALNNILAKAEKAFGGNNSDTARDRMKRFIGNVVDAANLAGSDPNRVLLDEANSLICGGRTS